MPDVAALSESYWAARCAAFPLEASALGYRAHDERVPDLRPDAQAAEAASFRELAARAEAFAAGDLTADDRVTATLLAWDARAAAGALDEAAVEHTVAPAVSGPLAAVFETCPIIAVDDDSRAAALVVRYRRLGTYFDTATNRVLAGVRGGRPPVAHATRASIEWLDTYLASAVDTDPLLAPAPPAGWQPARAAAWREALRFAVETSLRPALARYRDALAHQVLPRARPPGQAGLCWIDGGEQLYASAVRRCTTRALDPDELHELGLAELARLDEEYATLGARSRAGSDPAALRRRLRHDPALRFASGGAIIEAARAALARAEAVLPGWVRRLPSVGCEVVPMPAHEVEHSTIARYEPPAVTGTRPGRYYVNTHAPETRRRFESEALAFHEAVPGHHTQIALAQELDVPTFRRHMLIDAYTEGWALYAERLADELGLYSSDLDRLGMLGFDSWRAGRLVVDTGIHHRGWSRDEALAFLRDTTPLAENNIVNEVDRYIVLPAQALSYKVGQLGIAGLRRHAADRLGAAFDVAGFHDAVLGQGPVPLDLLDDLVGDWVAQRVAGA